MTVPPTTGTLEISIFTSGAPQDLDGYAVTVDDGPPRAIGPTETLTLEGLTLGLYSLSLSGIASNCHLDGENPRTVEVLAGSTPVTFDLTCLNANGLIAFTSHASGLLAIFTVNPDGSGLNNLTPPGGREQYPTWSPNGHKILFSINEDLYLMDADGRGRVILAEGRGISERRWSPDSRMIAYLDASQRGEDFYDDLWVLQADGTEKLKLAEEVSSFSWSRDGRLVYASSADLADVHLRIINVDASGDVRLTNRAAIQPAWSPDGTRIAFVHDRQIYLINPDGTGEVNLTQGLSHDGNPTWSPDGSRIAFTTVRPDGSEGSEVAVMNADGGGRTILTDHPDFDLEPVWSPDGARIVFTRSENHDTELYIMSANGDNLINLTNRPDTYESTPDWAGQ